MIPKGRLTVVAAALALSLAVSGCISNPSREDIGKISGTAIGIGLGSLIGGGSGKLAAMAIGGVAGFIVGGDIGRDLDRTDHEHIAGMRRLALDESMNDSTVSTADEWDTRQHYHVRTEVVVIPVPERHGTHCRSFTQRTWVRMNGRNVPAETQGVACWDPYQRIWIVQ